MLDGPDDRLINLAEEGYDVAVRVTGEPPGSLVARRLAPARRQLCATPEYFRRRGFQKTPEDLVHHNCLDYTRSGERGQWRFTRPGGEIAVPVTGPLHIDDDEALSQAVLGGLGVALLPTFIALAGTPPQSRAMTLFLDRGGPRSMTCPVVPPVSS